MRLTEFLRNHPEGPPFTEIMKVPPGLRTTVPAPRRTEGFIALHSLSNPVSLGGIASRPGAGPNGPRDWDAKMLTWNIRQS